MTDEIVKALEICNSLSQRCGDGCPYYTVIYKNGKRCSEMMIEDTLDLIKRQQAEIKELQEILGGTAKVQSQTCAVVRVKAVREFAERLKARYCTLESFDLIYVDEIRETIEKLVREVTEE